MTDPLPGRRFAVFVLLLLLLWGGWIGAILIASALFPTVSSCRPPYGAAAALVVACAVPPCVTGVLITRRLLRAVGASASERLVVGWAMGVSAVPFVVLALASFACI